MKTFKALYIDNGVIKAGEFPVEPDYCTIGVQDQCEKRDVWVESLHCYTCSCRAKEVEHQQALASAKANAVECEDQEEAAKVLAESEISGELFILPSGWDYDYETYTETVAKLCRTDEQKDEPDWEAISQLTLPESQEEIFDDLFSQYFKMLHEGHSMCKTGEILRERFTITRRK